MAFASLFSSPPGQVFHQNTTSGADRPKDKLGKGLNRDDLSVHSGKRPLDVRQGSGCRKKRTARQKPCRVGGESWWNDYDTEANSTVPFNFEQPATDFAEELNQYCQEKESKAHRQSPEQSDRPSGMAVDTEEVAPVGTGHRKNKQQRCKKRDRGGSREDNQIGEFTMPDGRSADHQRYFAKKDGHCSNRGRGFPNRGRGWTKRGGHLSKEGEKQVKKDWNWKEMDRPPSRRGRGNSAGRGRDHFQHTKKPAPKVRQMFMTQEFKDQNVVEVDGRFICKHFLSGRCIKGDECKLEHTLDVNIKKNELCKFYVQDCCTKGDNCMYMHSNFPCKFFHTSICFQDAECKYSHDPLTELTRQLLNDLFVIQSNDKMENKEQTPESPSKEKEKPVVDILLNHIRPNFYNSSLPPESPAGEQDPGCVLRAGAEARQDAAGSASPTHPPPRASYAAEASPCLYRPLDQPRPNSFNSEINEQPPRPPPSQPGSTTMQPPRPPPSQSGSTTMQPPRPPPSQPGSTTMRPPPSQPGSTTIRPPPSQPGSTTMQPPRPPPSQPGSTSMKAEQTGPPFVTGSNPSKSILSTLFLRLSPCHQEELGRDRISSSSRVTGPGAPFKIDGIMNNSTLSKNIITPLKRSSTLGKNGPSSTTVIQRTITVPSLYIRTATSFIIDGEALAGIFGDEDRSYRGPTVTSQPGMSDGELKEEEGGGEEEETDLRDEPLAIPLEPAPRASLPDPRRPRQTLVALSLPGFASEVAWSPADRAPLPPEPSVAGPLCPRAADGLSSERACQVPRSYARQQPPALNSVSQKEAGEHFTSHRGGGGHAWQAAGPGVHSLPVQTAARVARPPCQDLRQSRGDGRPRGNGGSIGDIFKSIDPTASPFCQ